MEADLSGEQSNLQAAKTNLSQARQNNASATEIEQLRNRVSELETKVANLEQQLAQAKGTPGAGNNQPTTNPNPPAGQQGQGGWGWLDYSEHGYVYDVNYGDLNRDSVRFRTLTTLPSRITAFVHVPGKREVMEVPLDQTDYRNIQAWLNDICEGNVNYNKMALGQYNYSRGSVDLWGFNGLGSFQFLFQPLVEDRGPLPQTGTATYKGRVGNASMFDTTMGRVDRVKYLTGETTLTANFSQNTIMGNVILKEVCLRTSCGGVTINHLINKNDPELFFSQPTREIGRVDLEETNINRSTVYYADRLYERPTIGNANGNVDEENYNGKYITIFPHEGFHSPSIDNDSTAIIYEALMTNDNKTRYIIIG